MRNNVVAFGARDQLLDRRAEELISRANSLSPAPRFEDVCRDFGLTLVALLVVAALAQLLLIVMNSA